MGMELISYQQLKDLLEYNPDTGEFIWIVKRKGTRGRGKPAGTRTSKGYIDVSIDGKKYGLHRLAFLYMNDTLPDYDVDHINEIKSDNRWVNLRPATVRQNSFNYRGQGTKSGYKNVYYDGRGNKKWFIRIFDNEGKSHNYGYFHTPEEANIKAIEIREKFHGEFVNHGVQHRLRETLP